MYFKKFIPRQFEYTPFKYDAEKDEDENLRSRVHFKRTTRKGSKGYSFLRLILLTIMIVFVIWYLNNY